MLGVRSSSFRGPVQPVAYTYTNDLRPHSFIAHHDVFASETGHSLYIIIIDMVYTQP